MNGKKILITGATGYIGSSLVEKLITYKVFDIAVLVRDKEKARGLFSNSVSYISYNDNLDCTPAITRFSPEIVIHLAAYSTSSDCSDAIEKLIQSNIIFTSNLLIALSTCDIKLFINTGSFSEYHNTGSELSPTYFYSTTKTSARFMIEYYAKKYDFKFVNAVLYSVYGKKSENKKIIDYALDALDSKIAINMSEGKQLLDFIYIDDVVNFYCNFVLNYENLSISQISYDLGTEKATSIRELVKIMEQITNKKANIAWGANQTRKMDTLKACANMNKTKEDLEYTTDISLKVGLTTYISEVLG